MPTLYEISEDLLRLKAYMEELGGDVTDEDVEREVTAWFESANLDLDTKVDNYCALIKELEARAATRKAAAQAAYEEYKRAQQLEQRDLSEASRLKYRLVEFFQLHGMKSLETRRFRPAVERNGGKLPLYVNANPEDLPDEFCVIKREVNNEAIRSVLEKGEELEFAILGERGVHLRIR
jgi:hypothetical protein